MSLAVVFAAFWALLAFTWVTRRRSILTRGADEWVVDLSGLLVQGAAVPLGQWVFATWVWPALVPGWRAAWDAPAPVAFRLDFVVVDYLYYWNHRLLHVKALWRFHEVHHTATAMDVLVTSRNTLFTPLLIVYFWAGGLLGFVLADPAPFALAAAVTAALDLWRHSPLAPPIGSAAHRALAAVLITPHEHAWHHSRSAVEVNFGANLSLWDRLHGSYAKANGPPEALGVERHGSLWRQLLFPGPTP